MRRRRKRGKKRNKALDLRKHAKRRALERYGIDLNRTELKELVAKIQREEGVFIEKQSNRVSVWAIQVKGSFVPVVYDSLRSEIVTFLPEGSVW